MKLSVIIPIHNEGPFLERCLNSIPEHPDVEVIAIDDASTDNSAEILQQYKDRDNFKAGYHSTNWGVSMTRNHGLTMATGDFVAFQDADDALHPKALETMLRVAEEYGDAESVIMFNHMRVYGQAMPTPRFENNTGRYNLANMPQKWEPVWGKLYRRSFIQAHGFSFKQGLDYGEDELFNLECIRECGSIFCYKAITVIKHFDNPDSLTHTLTKQKLTGLTRALEDLIEEDNPPKFDAAIRQLIADHWNSKTYIKLFGRLEG